MIDKIVQMSVREYESLQQTAKYKEEQIKLSRLSRILWLIAASGWGVAAVLFCI